MNPLSAELKADNVAVDQGQMGSDLELTESTLCAGSGFELFRLMTFSCLHSVCLCFP